MKVRTEKLKGKKFLPADGAIAQLQHQPQHPQSLLLPQPLQPLPLGSGAPSLKDMVLLVADGAQAVQVTVLVTVNGVDGALNPEKVAPPTMPHLLNLTALLCCRMRRLHHARLCTPPTAMCRHCPQRLADARTTAPCGRRPCSSVCSASAQLQPQLLGILPLRPLGILWVMVCSSHGLRLSYAVFFGATAAEFGYAYLQTNVPAFVLVLMPAAA